MKSNTIPFGDYGVRVLYGEDRSIAWINLQDLCHVLGRPELINDELAMKACSSKTQILFRKRGRPQWGISPFDVYKLLRPLRQENTTIADLCVRIEAWLNELLEKAAVKASVAVVTEQEPLTFSYQDKFPVSFIAANGKLMINATQMSKGFGVQPTFMLRRADIMRYRQELVDKGISESLESQVFTVRGRNHGATWIEQSLAIEYARMLSPEFSVWCNNCVSELMSSGQMTMENFTRKEGVTIPDNCPVPSNMEDARKMIVSQHQQLQVQQSQLKESHHKVEYYDNTIENRDFFTTTFIASELEISAYQLHTFLAENNICKREKQQWVVLAPFRPWQCNAPYYRFNKRGRQVVVLTQKRWTKFGREQIHDIWRNQPPKVKVLPPKPRPKKKDAVVETFKTTELADELNITPYRLHHFLADHNVCYFDKGQWIVFSNYASWQCSVPCYRTCRISKSGKKTPTNKRKRWTEEGREKILKLWRRYNPKSSMPHGT